MNREQTKAILDAYDLISKEVPHMLTDRKWAESNILAMRVYAAGGYVEGFLEIYKNDWGWETVSIPGWLHGVLYRPEHPIVGRMLIGEQGFVGSHTDAI